MKKLKLFLMIAFLFVVLMTRISFAQEAKGNMAGQNAKEVKVSQDTINGFTSEEWKQIDDLKKKFLVKFFYISFSNVVAQDHFMDRLIEQNLSASAFGFGLGGGSFVSDQIPVAFGFDLNFNFFQSQTRYTPYYNGYYGRYQDTVSTSALFIPFNAFMRIAPDLVYLQPYIEIFAGFTPMRTSISVKSYNYDETVNDDTAFPFHWGFGAGLTIPFFTNITIPNSKIQMTFDVNFRLIKGSSTEITVYELIGDGSYYQSKTITTDATDLFMMKMGVLFRF
jgi:hypothetical protein